jgi:hypothetical protein
MVTGASGSAARHAPACRRKVIADATEHGRTAHTVRVVTRDARGIECATDDLASARLCWLASQM